VYTGKKTRRRIVRHRRRFDGPNLSGFAVHEHDIGERAADIERKRIGSHDVQTVLKKEGGFEAYLRLSQ
jgi:hypothetical protein